MGPVGVRDNAKFVPMLYGITTARWIRPVSRIETRLTGLFFQEKP